MSTVDSGSRLLGRRSECAALDELVASVRAGASRALVLRGEAGVGKSALLSYLASRSSGCTVARATGVESEMELAFAGLQQLCAPFADRLERLPAPQRDALGTAFGLRDGDTPDRFLGTLEYDIDGQEPLTVSAGEALTVPAETVHAVKNVGGTHAAELATYVVEKDKPFLVVAE
jgi:hypothetical protein